MGTRDVDNWRWWLWPLRSRKVLVALATIVAAWAMHLTGLAIDTELVVTVLATGVALILGIAVEDAGGKARPDAPPPAAPLGQTLTKLEAEAFIARVLQMVVPANQNGRAPADPSKFPPPANGPNPPNGNH